MDSNGWERQTPEGGAASLRRAAGGEVHNRSRPAIPGGWQGAQDDAKGERLADLAEFLQDHPDERDDAPESDLW